MSGDPTDDNYFKHLQINWTYHQYPIILSASMSDQHVRRPVACVQIPTFAKQILSLFKIQNSRHGHINTIKTSITLPNRRIYVIQQSTFFLASNNYFHRINRTQHHIVFDIHHSNISISIFHTKINISSKYKITELLITLNCFIRFMRTFLQKKKNLVITMWIQLSTICLISAINTPTLFIFWSKLLINHNHNFSYILLSSWLHL